MGFGGCELDRVLLVHGQELREEAGEVKRDVDGNVR